MSTFYDFGKCINSSNHTDIARLKILIFVGHTSTSFLYKILSLFLDSTIPKKIFIISSYQKNVDGFQNEILWLHQPILLIYFRTKKMHRNILLILLHATFKKRIIINLAKNKPSLQVFTISFIIKNAPPYYTMFLFCTYHWPFMNFRCCILIWRNLQW